MARSFLTTDVINCGSVPGSTALTFMAWSKNLSPMANQPRMFGIGTTTQVLLAPTGDLRFTRDFATTDGDWKVVAADLPSLTSWHHFAFAHDGTTAFPTIFIDGVSKTVAQVALPVGSVVTSSQTLYVGNNAAGTKPAGGSLAHFAVVGRVLTAGEVAMHMQTGFIDGASLLIPIWGDSTEPDISGNKRNGTVTGTTITSNPPTLPRLFPSLWQRREEYAAAAEVAGQPMALRHTLDLTGARRIGRGVI